MGERGRERQLERAATEVRKKTGRDQLSEGKTDISPGVRRREPASPLVKGYGNGSGEKGGWGGDRGERESDLQLIGWRNGETSFSAGRTSKERSRLLSCLYVGGRERITSTIGLEGRKSCARTKKVLAHICLLQTEVILRWEGGGGKRDSYQRMLREKRVLPIIH